MLFSSPPGSDYTDHFDAHFTNQSVEMTKGGETVSKDFAGFDYISPEQKQPES